MTPLEKLMQNLSKDFWLSADTSGMVLEKDMDPLLVGILVWYPAWSKKIICVGRGGSPELRAIL